MLKLGASDENILSNQHHYILDLIQSKCHFVFSNDSWLTDHQNQLELTRVN